jgi:hypothetical protein
MTDRMIEVYKGICRNVRKILIVIVSWLCMIICQ